METMRSGHVKEREGLDDGTVKLKDELRQTRAERNQLELSKHELEAVSQSWYSLVGDVKLDESVQCRKES